MAFAKPKKAEGFILISMLFMMVLLAVTAITLNRRAALQSRMASNQINSIQISLGQEAATQHGIWKLTKDPMWRTAAGGEDYTYAGTTYNRKVLSSTVSGYTDAVMVSVKARGAARGISTGFRYYLDDLFIISSPNQIFIDTWDNIFIADPDNHSIFKKDGASGEMSRVAGTGLSGFSGDGGPATSAQLNGPYGVWVDNSGIIYIADSDNNRIRKVDLAGNISTYAGTGTAGYDVSEDGGPATSAKLKKPLAVYGDTAGNIFIADTENRRIRKVDTSGIITTIAGDGTQGFLDHASATSGWLNDPSGIFVTTAGSIYIADRDNHRIRKFTEGGPISTVAGTGTAGYNGDSILATNAQLNYPRGIFVDESSGIIYIGDSLNHRVRIFVEGGNIATLAGTGTAGYSGDGGTSSLAQLDTPRGVFKKSSGELVIADNINSCLREVSTGLVIDTITAAGDPGFNSPAHIAMDSNGNVYIADKDNHRIRTLDTVNKVLTVAGTGVMGYSGDGGQATSAQLDKPMGVDLDDSGNFYIADTKNHIIRKVTKSTGIIARIAGKADGPGITGGGGGPAVNMKMDSPEDVAVFNVGGGQVRVYFADTGNHVVQKIDQSGGGWNFAGGAGWPGYSGDGGAATSAQLRDPAGVTVDSSENVYIADTGNHCIRKVNTSGNISTVAGIGTQGGYSGDGGAATSAKLNKPNAVFVDSAGNIFISDRDNSVIRVVSAQDDKIYTLAGTGTGGYNGGDQPAVGAKLDKPCGITMASTRGGMKIYLSDRDNNRIRTLGFRIEKKLY